MSINEILTVLKGAADMGDCWYLFVIPLIFNILDVITGFTAALANHNVSSSAMREGLFHKLGFIFALILAALLQYASGLLDLGVEIPTLAAVAVFIILTEAVSILENIAEVNPALANNSFFKIFETVIHSGEKE